MVMSTSTRHLGVAEAKAQFAAIVRDASERRTIIQRRGKDVAVVLGVDELHRLEQAGVGATDGARVLAAMARWRSRTGGVEGFDPEPARIVPAEPFATGRRRPSKR